VKKAIIAGFITLISAVGLQATEFQVATNGSDANPGTKKSPWRTIQHAADLAQPGDVITVHQGVYRERIDPPRGGTSNDRRIVYQAARGEHVVITGSEPVKNWQRVTNDIWRVTLPNSFFGAFNPFDDVICGDWCSNPHGYHTGEVYLNGDWLEEATTLNGVLNPGSGEKHPGFLLNVAWIRPANLARTPADHYAEKSGMKPAPCVEGGNCMGWIEDGNWIRYDQIDFGTLATNVEIRAASLGGHGTIELHLDKADGELLGKCLISKTGDWQAWKTLAAKIKPTSGVKNLCLVFKWDETMVPFWFGRVDPNTTTIWAQFPDANPNEQNVEINVRKTVFTPSRTGINFITVRGFDLCNAAPPWAPPTAAQIGIISAYWCKGWIIEHNNIGYSPCCGVALGKYGDEWDNGEAIPDKPEWLKKEMNSGTGGYVATTERALKHGWKQATIGSHLVRNNEISHCEQTGIVGSLGCAFSTIAGNEIHDIHVRDLYTGEEMAGIKFHGAIDVVISHNHIYRCGNRAGIWLDWMGQGSQITGNLMHDNDDDIFLEMQHGPILVANNVLLSRKAIELDSEGIAWTENLIAGSISSRIGDERTTPIQLPHSTVFAGMYPSKKGDSGDYRFYNNLFVAPGRLSVLDTSALQCFNAGNVFTKGTKPSKYDTNALVLPDFSPNLKLEQKTDGWYLTLAQDPSWRDTVKDKLVTTDLLGKAKITGCAYENPDGSPLEIVTDYFGKKRNKKGPFPGPFEKAVEGCRTIKVWPVDRPAN
jgi:hypothetical protein